MRVDPNELITMLLSNNGMIRKTARDMGVSPSTVINWRKRATSIYSRFRVRTNGLARKSTTPKNKRITNLDALIQDRITSIRKDKGFCAQKITGILGIEEHHRTVHRFLKVKGLIAEQKYHRRPLFQNTKHMHSKNVKTLGKLQMDVKYVTPELSGLDHTCYLYAVMDIISRYKQGIICPLLDQSYSIESLKNILSMLPVNPDFIQTDNGLEFQARFHKFVTDDLGWLHHHIHKGNPNENAVIERSFRTDEEEFFFFRLQRLGRPKDILDLNLKYQIYLKEYNEERPHLSLPDMMTPMNRVLSLQAN
jgi:transposase InsO family protein